MESSIDWTRHPAMIVWTDDWNMCAWAPDRATWEKTRHLPFMQTRWSSGTLETAPEVEALFDVLRRHRSGDGLPVTFEAYYVVGNPDFDAIRANGFQHYVDVGIDAGVPDSWQRGPFLDKSKEGVAEGIWRPEYHFRSHHFSAENWMRRLRNNDPVAREMFELHMYVSETVPERTNENDEPFPDPFGWIRTGVERFERAFGYAPTSIRNHEQDHEPIAAAGIRTATLADKGDGFPATGTRSTKADLFHMGRCLDFEPFMSDDMDDVLSTAKSAIADRLTLNTPAILSSHRRNYASFAGDVERNLACLDALLGHLETTHPDMTYLINDEVRQLWESGVSTRHFGGNVLVRNWTDAGMRSVPLQHPAGWRATGVETLRQFGSGESPQIDAAGTQVVVPPGDYRVTMERTENE